MDLQFVIEIHKNQQYEKDNRAVNQWACALFGVFFIVAWFVIISLIRQLSSQVKHRILRLNYINLLWLWLARMIWFAGAFKNNYPMILYFLFEMLPALLLFTAASILTYFWFTLNLQWRWLVMEINDNQKESLIYDGFRMGIIINLVVYIIYIFVFIMVQTMADLTTQILTIHSMYAFTDIAWGVGNVVTGQTLISKVKSLTGERPYRIMFIMYMVVILDIIRFTLNIIISTHNSDWISFQNDHKTAFAAIFTIFVLVCELLPMLIVLFTIRQACPEKFERNESLIDPWPELLDSKRQRQLSLCMSPNAQKRLLSTYSSAISTTLRTATYANSNDLEILSLNALN